MGKTSFYRPNQKTITVFITDRHLKDIMRSLVHKIVHYEQDYRHNLSDEHRKNLKDKQYAQHDSVLRQLEEDAYLRGNIIFRDWEDYIKNKFNNIKVIIKQYTI